MDLEDANPSDVYVCGSGKKLTRDANIVERLFVVVQKLHATLHHQGIRRKSLLSHEIFKLRFDLRKLHHYSRLALKMLKKEYCIVRKNVGGTVFYTSGEQE